MTSGTTGQAAGASRSFAALRHPGFRAFVGTYALAMMADNVEHVISYWVIFQKFQSPALGGFAVISHWAPYLLFSVPVGAIAERVDPRRMIQLGMVMFIAASVGWGWFFATDTLELWHAVLLLVLHGAAGVFWQTASQLLLYDIVSRDELPSAVRLNATARYLGFLVGNTVLHLLAAAQEAGVNFTMADIDRMSRRVPCLAKVAPATQQYHMEDVHRAGGIMAILGELDRAGLLNRDCPTVLYPTLGEALDCCDVKRNADPAVHEFFRAAPGGVPTQTAFSQNRRFPKLDLDRANGCIRDQGHAYSQDGGLAVLFGNIAEKGCIVKTAGVDDSILKFTGRARVCESQEEAVEKILAGKIVAGDVVVVRYEGPKGGPGMQEMLYPTSYIKSMGLGKECALLTDGRFSGGTSGLSIGHASPEAAAGGAIGLVEEGDTIEIDIPNRRIHLAVEKSVLVARRKAMEAKGAAAWKPAQRKRTVSAALKAYAAMTTSADTGAVRDVSQLER